MVGKKEVMSAPIWNEQLKVGNNPKVLPNLPTRSLEVTKGWPCGRLGASQRWAGLPEVTSCTPRGSFGAFRTATYPLSALNDAERCPSP